MRTQSILVVFEGAGSESVGIKYTGLLNSLSPLHCPSAYIHHSSGICLLSLSANVTRDTTQLRLLPRAGVYEGRQEPLDRGHLTNP